MDCVYTKVKRSVGDASVARLDGALKDRTVIDRLQAIALVVQGRKSGLLDYELDADGMYTVYVFCFSSSPPNVGLFEGVIRKYGFEVSGEWKEEKEPSQGETDDQEVEIKVRALRSGDIQLLDLALQGVTTAYVKRGGDLVYAEDRAHNYTVCVRRPSKGMLVLVNQFINRQGFEPMMDKMRIRVKPARADADIQQLDSKLMDVSPAYVEGDPSGEGANYAQADDGSYTVNVFDTTGTAVDLVKRLISHNGFEVVE